MEICATCPSIAEEDLRAALLLVVALLVNNLSKNRKYSGVLALNT